MVLPAATLQTLRVKPLVEDGLSGVDAIAGSSPPNERYERNFFPSKSSFANELQICTNLKR